MTSPESSREQEMSQLVENAKTEAGILLKDAERGDWLEVFASELEARMFEAKDGLTGKNIDEILDKVRQAEKLYKAAKENGEVPDDRIKMIDSKFDAMKIG